MPAPEVKDLLPASVLAAAPPPLPEVGEIDLIRHFTNLSVRNMSIDSHFYPLGSCTMKYNPKRHERLAGLPGMADLHPLQQDEACQGMLELLWQMQNILAEIGGLDAVSLQPAAGAHGELTAPSGRVRLLPGPRRETLPRPDPGQRTRHQPGQRGHCRLRRRLDQKQQPGSGRHDRPAGQAR